MCSQSRCPAPKGFQHVTGHGFDTQEELIAYISQYYFWSHDLVRMYREYNEIFVPAIDDKLNYINKMKTNLDYSGDREFFSSYPKLCGNNGCCLLSIAKTFRFSSKDNTNFYVRPRNYFRLFSYYYKDIVSKKLYTCESTGGSWDKNWNYIEPNYSQGYSYEYDEQVPATADYWYNLTAEEDYSTVLSEEVDDDSKTNELVAAKTWAGVVRSSIEN
jgi:hypothetical protein